MGEESLRGRGVELLQRLETLEKLVPNRRQLEKSIGMIVTQTQKGSSFTVRDKLNELKDRDSELLQFFLRNPGSIFEMPSPSEAEDGKVYNLECKSQMVDFFKRNPLNNIETMVSLEPREFSALVQVFMGFDKISDILTELKKEIQSKQNEMNIENLQKWIPFFDKMLSSDSRLFNSPAQLAELISSSFG